MTTEELYKPRVQSAAKAFAYSKALDMELKIIQYPGFESGICIMCEELLKDGLVDPRHLFHWLEAKTKAQPDNK